MNVRDLIPWGREQSPTRFRSESDPFMTLHREMNRLFDDVFRGFEGTARGTPMGTMSWPSIELTETDDSVRIAAELPGMNEKDVEVMLNDGILMIRGEKKSEIEDKARSFSERTYGRFERRIPLAWDVDEDKIEATFRNGVLTVSLPKSARAAEHVKRIAISGDEATKH